MVLVKALHPDRPRPPFPHHDCEHSDTNMLTRDEHTFITFSSTHCLQCSDSSFGLTQGIGMCVKHQARIAHCRHDWQSLLYLCCALLHSAAFAAARCTTASGICARRATFRPKDASATPGINLYRNVILHTK